ncbi:hypothetical protein [Streptomyces sp. NPDC049040]|uniref:hypothetical protein n=1 Tax=Streptomyces sp. NPDC049040 TaxID=3365593 RepID=UPI003718CC87
MTPLPGRGPGSTRPAGHPSSPPASRPPASSPPASPSSPGPEWDDVTVGPLTLQGLRGLESGDQGAHAAHDSDGWHYLIAAAVRDGGEVTVTIGTEQRARAGLEFGGKEGMAPAPSVAFHGCPDAATSYLGAFFVAGDGRACVPLDIRVGDGAPQRVVISFFNGECPA